MDSLLSRTVVIKTAKEKSEKKRMRTHMSTRFLPRLVFWFSSTTVVVAIYHVRKLSVIYDVDEVAPVTVGPSVTNFLFRFVFVLEESVFRY